MTVSLIVCPVVDGWALEGDGVIFPTMEAAVDHLKVVVDGYAHPVTIFVREKDARLAAVFEYEPEEVAKI